MIASNSAMIRLGKLTPCAAVGCSFGVVLDDQHVGRFADDPTD